jgi:molybdate transport system substrate-binding protein
MRQLWALAGPRRRPGSAALVLVAATLLAAGCSSSSGHSGSAPSSAGTATAAAGSQAPSAPSATATGSGSVNVLYAGSLVDLMEKQIGPAFHAATGYTFDGFSAGSSALATQIKGKVRQGDVFISASPTVNASLEGAANGNWVSWYATYANSPLVLGYNPHGAFAADLTSKPWYQVITEKGFLLGRTDPATDPKGKLAVQALTDTAKAQNLPALTTISSKASTVFPEETLVGRLQAGQLDAGFFYSSEAVAAKIPTVPLAGINLEATYTVTVLNNAPHEAGADAFVAYLLGSAGAAFLQQDGFELVSPPAVSGTGAPNALQSVLQAQ